MIKSISVKGQLVLPSKLRRKYGITAGSPVNIFDTGAGILIEPLHTSSSDGNFVKKSKIDGGPVLSFKKKQILASAQVAKLLEESE
ncbi:MAG: AbrB/MazE/SpoVT family DNA-binding domain-containing protein [Verrucomicrobia bacterium]|nr:AbrB/MazE/SpoVT family DNA-binding domain-containing protein [Verrucomicrobiota bacterium]MDA1066275.1 AbrB/MazE/SpoVT family DNA-binding domain-containing protein [Verrucomicrobiota bacterium]